ncbi:MAG: polysaccharide pyruvyl transferase family protein [Gomphosphaeria aponina SAG 52.96 = DSM 107014]|uniref:Polysaccharide pyruvyl transferase family protein n=1 Tax=Gomphosphaeria aponina SAG 52.96 = DSM 107014 TaxID=1521640 RepID=A0A941GND0_9CHRO|nr:polysaccharide pyruvyl transferase family protein [Gomphosphaeria aponina SAG 52.96 = DSM 107014]
MQQKNSTFILCGAELNNSNLGVAALCHATISALTAFVPNGSFVIFDYGDGVRTGAIKTPQGSIAVEFCGAKETKRIYKSEALSRIRLAAKLGGLANPAAKRLLGAKAVLDITGGDSFTDLYGEERFRSVTLPKLIALENNIPLILLPQTYGPFATEKAYLVAARVARGAKLAWARDLRSYEELKSLLGDEFDPNRHRVGVDVAFLLQKNKPEKPIPEQISQWMSEKKLHVGFNISGLIYNNPEAARSQYGFKADYRQVVTGFLAKLLKETDAVISLIPHVLAPKGETESDPAAIAQVVSELGELAKDRVAVVPAEYDQCEMKWIISQTDWFCGTRMHSTIAGLSSGVPTAAIAYSPKTLGVFETCGQGKQVADPRSLTTEKVIEQLWQSWNEREVAASTLSEYLPQVIAQAKEQMEAIATMIGMIK